MSTHCRTNTYKSIWRAINQSKVLSGDLKKNKTIRNNICITSEDTEFHVRDFIITILNILIYSWLLKLRDFILSYIILNSFRFWKAIWSWHKLLFYILYLYIYSILHSFISLFIFSILKILIYLFIIYVITKLCGKRVTPLFNKS